MRRAHPSPLGIFPWRHGERRRRPGGSPGARGGRTMTGRLQGVGVAARRGRGSDRGDEREGRGARAGAGAGDGEEMAGEVWQAQPAATLASRRPCTIVCPPVIVRPMRARRAGCGGWGREGKGCSGAGGDRRSPGWASARRSPSGVRPARPCRRSLLFFSLEVHLCPRHCSHGGTQGFLPSRLFRIAPVRVLGFQGWRVYG